MPLEVRERQARKTCSCISGLRRYAQARTPQSKNTETQEPALWTRFEPTRDQGNVLAVHEESLPVLAEDQAREEPRQPQRWTFRQA